MVCEDASYLVMFHLWGYSSAHAPPFYFPAPFYFIRFISHSDPFFCDIMRPLGSSASTTFIFSSCFYSLYMADTNLSPCFLVLFFAVISVNVTFTASFCMSRINILLLGADELGVIFLPYKFHLNALNTFPWVGPSLPYVGVFTLISLHISCFYFPFILFCLCISILILFCILWLFHVFIFNYFICVVIYYGGVFFVMLVLVFDAVVT